ncbi:hypothetical protein FA048_14725 [Pedobacter polaris]|uniref:Lipoprotein n=1 Tax=Pedobacter polaris TaxID=2571273 RepID=A0A4V5NZG0_9SPHI|nr:hypothetical protein [Pedobacter polaris]TKC08405.1 hypothetical protein FA048_14725 [Pedobacter polaris]
MNKHRLFLCSITLAIFLLSNCTQQKAVKHQMDAKHTICYTATDQRDTAWLKIDTANQHILGELTFTYQNGNHYEGLVKAVMKGDTLKGYYSFRLNKVDKWYKNPIALLKKENTLTMGIGEMMTLWGSGFFDKSVPIDYEKARFVFEQTGCAIN